MSSQPKCHATFGQELVDTAGRGACPSEEGSRSALPPGRGATMSELIDRAAATADHADRGSGAAQDPRVIELRVHGVSGTPPEQMLDEPFPRQVAGDDVGRFFRRARPISVD